MSFVGGCDSEDDSLSGVGPEEGGAYEAAIFGTFKGISVIYSTDGTTGMPFSLDTTSYIRINKLNGTFSFRIRLTHNEIPLTILFEDSGDVIVENVIYTPVGGSVYTASWKGWIYFNPLPALGHYPWMINFIVYDTREGRNRLWSRNGPAAITLAPQSYLLMMGWKPEY